MLGAKHVLLYTEKMQQKKSSYVACHMRTLDNEVVNSELEVFKKYEGCCQLILHYCFLRNISQTGL